MLHFNNHISQTESNFNSCYSCFTNRDQFSISASTLCNKANTLSTTCFIEAETNNGWIILHFDNHFYNRNYISSFNNHVLQTESNPALLTTILHRQISVLHFNNNDPHTVSVLHIKDHTSQTSSKSVFNSHISQTRNQLSSLRNMLKNIIQQQ